MSDQAPGIIREINAKDLPRVHEIAVAGWRPIYARYRMIVGETMWQDLWGNWEEGWFAHSPETWKGKGVVTEMDGEVAGFATWWFPGDDFPEVGGNAVDPAFQGQGIGSAQIEWVIGMFRREGYKYAKVRTGLDPAHGPARAEYRNAGLRLGVTNSEYYNYLDEVACVPIRDALSFRWAEPGDAEMIRQLTRCSWTGVYEPVRKTLGDALFTVAFGDAIEQRVEELTRIVSDIPNRLRIATKGGQAIGFAAVDEDGAKKLGIIETVAIDPGFRDQGVGCALCMDAFALFRERDLRYARLTARSGEMNERVRRMCWNVGLYRELPSIDYQYITRS